MVGAADTEASGLVGLAAAKLLLSVALLSGDDMEVEYSRVVPSAGRADVEGSGSFIVGVHDDAGSCARRA